MDRAGPLPNEREIGGMGVGQPGCLEEECEMKIRTGPQTLGLGGVFNLCLPHFSKSSRRMSSVVHPRTKSIRSAHRLVSMRPIHPR